MIKIKNCTIEVVKKDITSVKVDAIVSAANSLMDMETGSALAIRKKGGDSIEEEARAKAPVRAGDVVATRAGKLKAKYVIHAVTKDNQRKSNQTVLREASASALKCANKLKLKSIALPAIGCGKGAFPPVGAAKVLTQEILKSIRTPDSTLQKIVICLTDPKLYRMFNDTIYGYIQHLQDDLGWGPYVTVDAIIEVPEGIILIERSNPPYGWALPGGFVDNGESLEDAVVREVKEETNLDFQNIKQFHTYSKPGRDPRFNTISTIFVGQGIGHPKAGDDAKNLKIVPAMECSRYQYAFDHYQVIEDYLKRK